MLTINPNSVYPEKLPKTDDYIIYAKLEVKKLSRSILLNDDTSQNTETLEISFLNSDINKKEHTTNWTNELINKDKINDETFGMTDIQIRFDKNNIPRVTIQFVDVRGASLIGNGNNSPYSALFHLPYPEFKLTVKGYYGKPVSYSLSLLDFSSRFNSQNGNFEITCEFIGFTYAKLTDIPASYLFYAKQLNGGETKEGNLPYLHDFIKNIENLNKQIENLESSEQVIKLNNINVIKSEIQNFLNEYKNGKDKKEFYSSQVATYIQKKFWDDLEILRKKGIVFDYIKETFTLQRKEYTNINELPPYAFYQSTTIKYDEKNFYFSQSLRNEFNKTSLTNPSQTNFQVFVKNQQDKVIESFTKLISNIDNIIETEKNTIKEKIENSAIETLGQKPTIKYVFDIILSDAEIFLKKIKEVAISAENQNNERFELFNKTDNDLGLTKKNKIFPFPAYYINENGNDEYRHEYLGNYSLLKDNKINRSYFPELEFTENFIKFQNEIMNQHREETIIQPESGWFPINPLESVYYFDGNTPFSPYKGITTKKDLLDKIIDRFIILLASYNTTSDLLIYKELAKLELNNLLLSFTKESEEYKKILKTLKTSLIKDIKGRINERIEKGDFIIKTIIDTEINPTNRNLIISNNEITILRISDNNFNSLNNNISSRIFDFENNVNNNITNTNLISNLNKYQSILPDWIKNFFGKDLLQIDGKSNLLRLSLDYDNFIDSSTIQGITFINPLSFKDINTTFLYDIKPNEINEIYNYFYFNYEGFFGVKTNINETKTRFDFLLNFYDTNNIDLSYFLFINFIYKINWDEIKKILTKFVGVIEIPYFTILQIGSILWDNQNNNRQGKNQINIINSFTQRLPYEIDYYDEIINSLKDYPDNIEIFINEFLNFKNNFIQIIEEIKLTSTKEKINVKTDIPKLYNFINTNKLLINPTYKLWEDKTISNPNFNDNLGYYRDVSEVYQTVIGEIIDNEINFVTKISDKNKKNKIVGSSKGIGYSYFETFQSELNRIINEEETEDKKTLQEVLNGFDDFKLETYNSFKSLYDRWIAGKPNEEYNLRKDFVYIDRFYKDIGDKMVINPQSLLNLKNNPKIPLYSIISNLLSENKVDFHPLPGFITNFNSDGKKLAEEVFGQYKTLNNTITSPKFICMYVGGTSKYLNLIKGDFLSDTTDINPKDYKEDKNNPLGYIPFSFEVRIGDQTQSHFRDIELDQKQFKVTNESLQIEDDIARSANTRRGILKSQSLYNIYLQYSYSAKIRGLGNMMIQPLLYFSLPTIPLFQGYYLIIGVEHSIKPNFMETSFTGVRLSRATLPIVKSYFETLGINSDEIKESTITSTYDGWVKQLQNLGDIS